MKAMKSMNVNRMLGSLKRKPRETASQEPGPVYDEGADTPEANGVRNVQSFCLSGGPNGSGEEVVYLPVIVESVDASPQAAKECAVVLRKYLSKDNYSKPYIQYNAIMLVRILADNPGKTFTRNVDAKFVDAIKQLLRLGRDPSVRQLLVETLNTLQRDKAGDEGLAQLLEMWKRENEKMTKLYGPPGAPRQMNAPPPDPNSSQNYFSRSHSSRHLPSPAELSSRIEEARTSATLLAQTVQSTPPSEIIQNELVREFADRCQSASRSIQAYMIAENPSPDNDTMETLIETNEQLTKAMSQHQRAILTARKAAGTSTPSPANGGAYAPPPGPPPSQAKPRVPSREKAASPKVDDAENPFMDPEPPSSKTQTHNPPFPKDEPPAATGQFDDRLGIEPYHPGFTATPSYVGRQDSSIGKTTMHAAVPEAPETDSDGEREANRNIQPKTVQKQPVYRY
ncbi:GAT domain-containing protein [Phlyctema vagabunda]|uniref:GAT domain-containing protein n=1 Tax=Phlyctema vagabunda TaxID=108571 RepID=A0ABR4PHH2_9HELO